MMADVMGVEADKQKVQKVTQSRYVVKNVLENESDDRKQEKDDLDFDIEMNKLLDEKEEEKWFSQYSIEDLMNSTKGVVKSLMLYQKSVELIGIVQSTEILSNVFKFVVLNDEKIQVLAFHPETEKVKNVIQGCLIHIEGAYVKYKHDTLSKSDGIYDVYISSNCEVTVIKDVVEGFQIQRGSPVLSTIMNCCSEPKNYIQVSGYISSQINTAVAPNGLKYNKGCVCDGNKYKVEIRMTNIIDMSEFAIGCPVTVTGEIQYGYGNLPYIEVDKKSDISLTPDAESKEIWDLLNATETPKRKMVDEKNDNVNKKMKK